MPPDIFRYQKYHARDAKSYRAISSQQKDYHCPEGDCREVGQEQQKCAQGSPRAVRELRGCRRSSTVEPKRWRQPPTTSLLKLAERNANPPARPPTNAINRSSRFGAVRLRISLPTAKCGVERPITQPIARTHIAPTTSATHRAPKQARVSLGKRHRDPEDWTI